MNLNLTSLISSEMDFMSEFSNVTQLDTMPSTLNAACLGNTSCLGAIARANGADAVLAGSATPVSGSYEFKLVYYDAGQNRILRTKTFSLPDSPAAIADGIARKLQVPLVQAYNVPLTPTAAFPGALMPGLDFGAFSRRLGHRLTRQALWLTTRSSVNEVLREVLDAPPMGLFPPRASGLSDGPVLYGFSEAFLPRGPEWKNDVEVTGFWFVEESSGFSPSPDLAAFLAAGPAPVCIGFGSMTSEDPKRTTTLVLEAVKQAGVRCVLLSGWAGLAPEALPPTVFLTKSVAHSWLYPRCSAVVHHGGAGTTAAALRAGVPALVVPFHGDQPFWASRVKVAGTGPAPIPKKQLTVKALVAGLVEATTNEAMKGRCAEVGVRVRSEAGVARAVERIAELSHGV